MRGIEGCVPLIHGSQGCATYIRRYGISHFREPIDIASSNFVEATAIFGGRDNLFRAIDNVIKQYQPAVIGITSTCLSETIGDDVKRYLHEYKVVRTKKSASNDVATPIIFYASTPSYRGTHIVGFHEAINSVIETVATSSGTEFANGNFEDVRINLISGFVSAADLRELHEILSSYGVCYTLLPDYSETLDGGVWEEYQRLPAGGTPLRAIAAMSNARGTIYLGNAFNKDRNGAFYLQSKFGVQMCAVNLPIGIENTDRFFETINMMTGKTMPEKWAVERRRLIDAYFDGHKYCSGKGAVLYGDIDFVTAMRGFLSEIGVRVLVAADGAEVDFVTMLEMAADKKPDFVIGNSKGIYLARELNIPLVRCSFPIHDRIGGQRILHLGYRGTLNLFERICNVILEKNQNSMQSGWTYV
jgi:nitrogenase molybdenum-iron protein NifN